MNGMKTIIFYSFHCRDRPTVRRQPKCKISILKPFSPDSALTANQTFPHSFVRKRCLKVALETDNQITAVKDSRVVQSLKAEGSPLPHPFIARLPGLLQSFSPRQEAPCRDRSGFGRENGAAKREGK
ncbi:hypothetical protein CDAR_184761 [Caerostris darwini]|uniref:Uncharacterized protein n=1 Tax=Caerostris darwini TaxID=1538125 RepID=A0AAV4VWG5_9ARAC|nr:hypothetical protein CDAR_184761 [Caerostris darwini]